MLPALDEKRTDGHPMRQFPVILAFFTLLGLAGPLFGAGPARAADIDDFNAAVEQVSAHGRVAVGYLRSENMDLADVEIDRMGDAWRGVVDRFGATRPAAFVGSTQFGTVLVDVSTRLITASMLLNSGRPANARDSLLAIRDELSQLRREAKVTVLADCVLDANAAMDALYAFNGNPPDWRNAAQTQDLATKAGAYEKDLRRCDAMASEPVRKDAQFRRLVDGALNSLTFVPKAIAAGDSDLLHRVLIELRSFDNLLAFGFG
jgi:hypothetical protein